MEQETAAPARVSPEQQHRWEPYVRVWRTRLAAEERARQAVAEELRAAARRCAEILRNVFGARRVYLFGSLSGRSAVPFGPHSDVDIAVEGLPPKEYWHALAAIEQEFPAGTRVDLLRLEDARPPLREKIQRSGELLGEQGTLRRAGSHRSCSTRRSRVAPADGMSAAVGADRACGIYCRAQAQACPASAGARAGARSRVAAGPPCC